MDNVKMELVNRVMNEQIRTYCPKKTRFPMHPEIKGRCFVISPIGEDNGPVRQHADMVLNAIIRKALPDFEVKRADEFASADMINDRVMDAIWNYDLAIADLTGHNPNVYYELGLRHMEQKPVIHIASIETKLPFDNAGMKTIFFNINDWHSQEKARKDIKTAADHVLAENYIVSNPVTQARGSVQLTKSADSNDQMVARMAQQIADLQAHLGTINEILDLFVSRESGFGTGYGRGPILAPLTQPPTNALLAYRDAHIGEMPQNALLRGMRTTAPSA